tara:strand:+ start:729 stop:938 length:210 start_codon:yes stop_codon:yes gene_type:complete
MKSHKYTTLLGFILITAACETKFKEIYVKARTAEELKINAFESCGRSYKVLKYEDDTARIKCLKKNNNN